VCVVVREGGRERESRAVQPGPTHLISHLIHLIHRFKYSINQLPRFPVRFFSYFGMLYSDL